MNLHYSLHLFGTNKDKQFSDVIKTDDLTVLISLFRHLDKNQLIEFSDQSNCRQLSFSKDNQLNTSDNYPESWAYIC